MKNIFAKKMILTGIIASTAMAAQSGMAAALYSPNLVQGGNHWTISAYTDNASDHSFIASHGVCFFAETQVGSEMHYIWVSDTYPGFAGRAAQEGDQVKMVGGQVGYTPAFIDAMQFEIVSASPTNIATGHWNEWRSSVTYATNTIYTAALMERDGPCPYATPEDALDQTPMRIMSPTGTSPMSSD